MVAPPRIWWDLHDNSNYWGSRMFGVDVAEWEDGEMGILVGDKLTCLRSSQWCLWATL